MNPAPKPTPVLLIAVGALAIGFVGSIAAIVFLAATTTVIPDALSDLPLWTGGALAGLLPGAVAASRPASVTIEQGEDNPVPTTVETGPST